MTIKIRRTAPDSPGMTVSRFGRPDPQRRPGQRKALILLAWLLVLAAGLPACAAPAATAAPRPGITVIRPPQDIDALVLLNGLVWAGGRAGLFCLDLQGRLLKLPFTDTIPLRYVKSLCTDTQGRLWIAHEKGLACYDGAGLVNWTVADGLPDLRVNTVVSDRAGRLWVGTWSGVLLLDGDQRQTLTTADGLLSNMVNVILTDRDGAVWFGSYNVPGGGISIRSADGTGWQYFTADNGLPNNNVTSLLQAADGRVWAGTGFYDHGGAAIFSQSAGQWQLTGTLAQDNGLAGAKVRSLFQATDGAIWIGSEYDGAAVLKEGQFRKVTARDGLANDEIKTLLQDETGSIWIGTRDGINRVNPAEFP